MLKHAPAKLGLVVVLVAGLVVSGIALAASLRLEQSAAVPQDTTSRAIQETIWFQGYLADSGTGDPINASYNVVARIYTLSSGGVLLWGPETHASVTITQGWFNIELGSVTPFAIAFDSPPYYLSLTVNGETLSPRLKLASVPMAYQTSGIALPYFGTYTGTTDAFTINNTGTGAEEGIQVFRSNSTTSGARAIAAGNDGPGEAIWAEQDGSTSAAGPAGGFYNLYPANTSPVINAWTAGTGPSYFGSSHGQHAAELYTDASGASADSTVHVVHAVYTGGAHDGFVTGVYGEALGADTWGTAGGEFLGREYGVIGQAFPPASSNNLIYTGVSGVCTTTSTGSNIGIWGLASNGATNYGGVFDGDVDVNGTLTKNAGAFKIDHPLDPANKYLSHSFVESPDMKNVYDGVIVLGAGGQAWVDLPDWFEALNRDFRYQLTCIGAFAPVYVADELSGNRFRIAGGEPGMKVSWQVTGIRHDKYADAHRIPVEAMKPATEQGKYRNPELYGMPESAAVNYEARRAVEASAERRSSERPMPTPERMAP